MIQESPFTAYYLTVAYDGTNFKGWQVQSRGVRTVQGEIESRLQRLFRNPNLRISGSSRTDAGVHALGMGVSFRVRETHGFTAESLMFTLNRWLPNDIALTSCKNVNPNFHARHDALGKTYIYSLRKYEAIPDPFETRYCWQVPARLNLQKMRECADVLVGEHDFKAFSANPKREMETTVRDLRKIKIIETGNNVYLVFTGVSFLYKMVRTLVGHLVHAGATAGWSSQRSRTILESKIRESHIHTAPSQGLFLARVFYDDTENWQHYSPSLPPCIHNPGVKCEVLSYAEQQCCFSDTGK
jgi:tRNA pseudouridine38-40 synthase